MTLDPEAANPLRRLPSVDAALQWSQVAALTERFGRHLTVEAVRAALEQARREFSPENPIPDAQELSAQIAALLESWTEISLRPVINATGVIIHTNLGRAPLSQAALQAAARAAASYSTLEFDLASGKRGSRLIHAEALLQRLTGAQAALVVNNNAAAVLLVLTALARRRKAVIARTQLVEIGGGFRVPDVMKQSGARLLEVGTTNRVHLADYEQALEEKPVLFFHAHRSNFQIIGFTSEPPLQAVAEVAHAGGIILVDDLGSGALLDTAEFGLSHEPTVQESLAAGADLVCFSGDKLLGGPQAGIIVGRADLVARLKKHPLARAIRADKLGLAALSATLLAYLTDEALATIPIWQMIATPAETIRARSQAWAENLGRGAVVAGESTVGGGSLPGETLPTYLLSLQARSPQRTLRRLRQAEPPVIGRVVEDRLVFDPRTVLPEQQGDLLRVLKEVTASG